MKPMGGSGGLAAMRDLMPSRKPSASTLLLAHNWAILLNLLFYIATDSPID